MLKFQRPHQINTIALLRRVYERYASWSWPLIRLALGLPLVAHGIQKLTAFFGLDLGRTSGLFEVADVSLGPAASYILAMVELVTAALIIVGFGTRPAALLLGAFLLGSVLLHLPEGYFSSSGGTEYPLVLLGLALAVLLKGGGEHSVDHRLRAEI